MTETDNGANELAPNDLTLGLSPKWRLRLIISLLAMVATGVVLITNHLMSDRFTETTRNRADLRLALYSGNMLGEMQRTSVVPLLLTSDPAIRTALMQGDFRDSSRRLIDVQGEIGVASILLLGADGRVMGATDRNALGGDFRAAAFFLDALRSKDTVFSVNPLAGGGYDFTYSRLIEQDGRALGVIVVAADMMKQERAWTGLQDEVVVTDSKGIVIMATDPKWRGKPMDDALTSTDGAGDLVRVLSRATDWTQDPPDAYLSGKAVLRTEARVPFQGWRMISFTAYDSVRAQVTGIIALEIMGFAILAAGIFYGLSRKAISQSVSFQRESAELRLLNARLNREISEREKVQKNLAVAELTLAQSSKLAALGEMSAAVSHELNQPLAAMKTYLAGARLLMQRKRTEEALSSFQRIDDLIDRMGAITRQLKSYARKGGEAFEPVDLRACLSAALSMMEPQLKMRALKITRTLPRVPVMVLADRLRLEQVIINLLRNAIDATKDRADPAVDLLLTTGGAAAGAARLSVRDNGTGIKDIDEIFEPFYTTKKPGDGVGLGLAISSGIMADMGGSLTARNADDGGAIFEMNMPLIGAKAE